MSDINPDVVSLITRPMTQAESRLLVDWAKAEGWNPGLNDAEIFWNTDPAGFIAAELNGELIGGGSIVAYEKDYGFMGLFIVKPEYRSKGLGRKLWFARRDMLKARLNDDAPIGMDGVVAMEPFYASGGFVKTHQNRRYQFAGRSAESSLPLVDAKSIEFSQVESFDRQYFPAARSEFLKTWLNQPEAISFVHLSEGKLTGLGVMRRCQEGRKIGPLYAETVEIADGILSALQSNAVGEPLFLDIPDTNQNKNSLIDKYQMEEVFSCARMYLGKAPELNEQQVFGITTFELG